MVNFGEIRRAQLGKSTSHLHVGAPGIFSDLLRSVQMLKREWGAEGDGKLPHLFVPSKIADLVPEFAVEDSAFGRTAALVPALCSEGSALGQITDDDDESLLRFDIKNYVFDCRFRHVSSSFFFLSRWLSVEFILHLDVCILVCPLCVSQRVCECVCVSQRTKFTLG